jgi:hypothetical protein
MNVSGFEATQHGAALDGCHYTEHTLKRCRRMLRTSWATSIINITFPFRGFRV